MSNPRFEYFNSSLDSIENRKLVELVSASAVENVRANEAEATPYVFNALMDRAARGEVVRVGESVDYGFGGGELLLYIIVPLVTNVMTAYFTARFVAGVRGLNDRQDAVPVILPEDVREYARLSGVHLKRKEDLRIAEALTHLIPLMLSQVMAGSGPVKVDRKKLRLMLQEAFTIPEMRTLCFDLDEPYEEVIIEVELGANAMRLIEYFRRRGRLDDLLAAVRVERPHLSWDDVLL